MTAPLCACGGPRDHDGKGPECGAPAPSGEAVGPDTCVDPDCKRTLENRVSRSWPHDRGDFYCSSKPAPSGAVTDKNSKREDVTAESLPLCPLCGDTPTPMGATDDIRYAHRNNGCDLGGAFIRPASWRRLAALRAEVEMYRKAEKDTSDAYVRLREIIGALRTVPGKDHIAHTEKIARTLVADRDREKAKVEQLIAYGTAERVRADALAVEVERLRDEWTFAAEVGTRLRAAIEAAPHGIGCAFCAWTGKGSARIAGPCDCWKSKALEGSAK